jgi:DNA (cytosine-5)-methyltransferase 1
MNAPRLLDLFCCEGGASAGYVEAGFEVFGVDLFADYSQKRYPHPSHKGDAIEYLLEHGREFDVIHASPPCQHASAGTRALRQQGAVYDRLIEGTRGALLEVGRPWVIENVKGAVLRDPIMLCGRQFGLTAVDDDGVLLHLDRHRMFESSMTLQAPATCQPHDRTLQVGGSYGGARRDKAEARHERHGGYVPSIAVQQALLGIDWMTQKGMHQSLPPAYTRFLGEQMLGLL